MALLSQLDKVKITTAIGELLQNTNIQNSGTVDIEIDLTAGQTSETTITDNGYEVSITQI